MFYLNRYIKTAQQIGKRYFGDTKINESSLLGYLHAKIKFTGMVQYYILYIFDMY